MKITEIITEVSQELRNRYVARASTDYSGANFGARMSKDHPGLEDYHQEQTKRAEKRAKGLNRALSDKRLGREVDEAAVGSIEVDDFVQDSHGKVYRVFGVRGTTLDVGKYYGPDSYGGTENLHITKVQKIANPELNEGVDGNAYLSNEESQYLDAMVEEYEEVGSSDFWHLVKHYFGEERVSQLADDAYDVWVETELNEGVQDTLSQAEATKVLKHYGARVVSRSEDLDVYAGTHSFSIPMIWGDDGHRHVKVSDLNNAVRKIRK